MTADNRDVNFSAYGNMRFYFEPYNVYVRQTKKSNCCEYSVYVDGSAPCAVFEMPKNVDIWDVRMECLGHIIKRMEEDIARRNEVYEQACAAFRWNASHGLAQED